MIRTAHIIDSSFGDIITPHMPREPVSDLLDEHGNLWSGRSTYTVLSAREMQIAPRLANFRAWTITTGHETLRILLVFGISRGAPLELMDTGNLTFRRLYELAADVNQYMEEIGTYCVALSRHYYNRASWAPIPFDQLHVLTDFAPHESIGDAWDSGISAIKKGLDCR